MDVGDDMDVNFQHDRTKNLGAPGDRLTDGLTLVELLVVIVVSGIVLGMAVPAFNGFLQSIRLTGQVNTLVADLNYSRSEAIKRMQRVALCKSADRLTCNTDARWADGWIVFSDRNGDGKKDSEEPLLRTRGSLPAGYTLSFRSFYTSDYVRYYPDGHAANAGTFTFCSPSGSAHARAVIIFRGRLRSRRTNSTGGPLNCASK